MGVSFLIGGGDFALTGILKQWSQDLDALEGRCKESISTMWAGG